MQELYIVLDGLWVSVRLDDSKQVKSVVWERNLQNWETKYYRILS